jgi:hypothetical protein
MQLGATTSVASIEESHYDHAQTNRLKRRSPGEPNDEFDQDCNGAINVMDLLAVVGAFNSGSSAAARTPAIPNLKLNSAIGRWHQTNAKSRALVLKNISRERAKLRALEAAQLSPAGFPRRTH